MGSIEDWKPELLPATTSRDDPRADGMCWPAGTEVVGSSGLAWVVASSAQHHARVAVRTHTSTDLQDLLACAVSTGTAVELLAKTYLLRFDRHLLAEKGHRSSTLLLTGHGSRVTTPATDFRSVSAAEALKLVEQFGPTPQDLTKKVELCLTVRNSAAHMALVDTLVLDQAVVQLCNYVEVLLGLLELDRSEFWEMELSTVDVLRDKSRSANERRVATKRATAAHKWAELLARFAETPGLKALVISQARRSSAPDEAEWTCPVCGHTAVLSCIVNRGPLEWVFPDEEYFGTPTAYVERTGTPLSFSCGVCGLEIEGGEELDALGVPDEVILEDDDDPFEVDDYEPDEDLARNR